jgi:hypothetical protein
MYNFELLMGFLTLMAAIIIPALIIGIGFYILLGFGLYTMAKRRGIANPWLAFIPFGTQYIMGALVGEVQISSVKLDAKLALPISFAACVVIGAIPLIGALAVLAIMIFFYMVVYKIYEAYKPDNAVLYLVLSIVFSGFAMPIIFFMIRNNEPNNITAEQDQNDIFSNPNIN